jgi:transposase InsO family protein
LPILVKTTTSSSTTTADHTSKLAFRMLGTGYDWTFQESSRRIHSDIIFRFGIPNSIITDLGSNFTSSEFLDFCEQKSIQIKYASVAHPRANG